MNKEERTALREEKIKARDSLTIEEREGLSKRIVDRVIASREFQQAKTIMIYRGIRGEVRLEALEIAEKSKGKQILFPLCLPNHEMAALAPEGNDAWAKGYAGIEEPVLERSTLVLPEDIDMIICPCTVFDEECNRMGMGGGFYDRYLPKCKKAVIGAVAFEIQKVEAVPMEPWDRAVDLVFTEEKVYGKR